LYQTLFRAPVRLSCPQSITQDIVCATSSELQELRDLLPSTCPSHSADDLCLARVDRCETQRSSELEKYQLMEKDFHTQYLNRRNSIALGFCVSWLAGVITVCLIGFGSKSRPRPEPVRRAVHRIAPLIPFAVREAPEPETFDTPIRQVYTPKTLKRDGR
jgi:hypothetical protein